MLSPQIPVPVEKIGVKDRFGESAGAEEMLEMMGLKSHHICDAVRRVIAEEGLKHRLH